MENQNQQPTPQPQVEIQPQVQPVVSPQNTEEKQNQSGNGFLVSLLSVLLLLACIAAGFFAYQTQTLVKELNSYKVVATPSVVPSMSSAPVETLESSPSASISPNPTSGSTSSATPSAVPTN